MHRTVRLIVFPSSLESGVAFHFKFVVWRGASSMAKNEFNDCEIAFGIMFASSCRRSKVVEASSRAWFLGLLKSSRAFSTHALGLASISLLKEVQM